VPWTRVLQQKPERGQELAPESGLWLLLMLEQLLRLEWPRGSLPGLELERIGEPPEEPPPKPEMVLEDVPELLEPAEQPLRSLPPVRPWAQQLVLLSVPTPVRALNHVHVPQHPQQVAVLHCSRERTAGESVGEGPKRPDPSEAPRMPLVEP